MQANHPNEWDPLATAVHAWYWPTAGLTVDSLAVRTLPLMSAEERGRLGNFQADGPRLDSLAARFLCRVTLSRYAGAAPGDWVFSQGAAGKPFVRSPAAHVQLKFNLTHTDGLAAIAVTRVGEVGIDAESAEGPVAVESVARHFLSEDERGRLLSLDGAERERRFRELWVVIEAYLKGRGTGLGEEIDAFPVRWGRGGDPLPIGVWQLTLHRPTAGHVAAVAVAAGGLTVPVVWREFTG